MQINYPLSVGDRAAYAPMWYTPNVNNTARNMDVPMVYFPYACDPGWSPSFANGSCFPDVINFPAAPTTDAAAASPAQALAPITLTNPLPSITPPPGGVVSSDQVPPMPAPVIPSAGCQISAWVTNNPGLATAAAVLVYLMVAGGMK